MKIVLSGGPDHGRIMTTDRTHGEVHRADGGYSYQLTDKEDEHGRRIAVMNLD